MVFLCKCCTRTHTHTQTFASVCVFAHTQISIIKLYVVSFRRAKPEIQIRDPNRDRAVLLLTRQNKYGDKVAHTGAKTKARINIYKYVKKRRNGNKMAQGDSMALAETLRRPHILRYLSLSLPTNFTATASALEAAGCELRGISKHTHTNT